MIFSKNPDEDPVAAQFWPREEEDHKLAYETPDPLGDQAYAAGPRLIHHYYDRVLLLVSDRCGAYCRYCFRRHFTAQDGVTLEKEELLQACDYLKQNPQVEEVLLTGGDPLMVSNDHLRMILEHLKEVRPDLTIRVGTRIPVVQPERVNQGLLEVLEDFAPLWMVLHINHPHELTPPLKEALYKMRKAGVQFLNQSVLLKGVNDDWRILKSLYRGLLNLGVKPYYLFQGDLASGTSHFRVNLERGLEIMDDLRRHLSGMGIPVYAVDLPQGGGKVPLSRDRIVKSDQNWYYIKNLEGEIFPYPREG